MVGNGQDIRLTVLWHVQRLTMGISPMSLILSFHHGFERFGSLKYSRHVDTDIRSGRETGDGLAKEDKRQLDEGCVAGSRKGK